MTPNRQKDIRNGLGTLKSVGIDVLEVYNVIENKKVIFFTTRGGGHI